MKNKTSIFFIVIIITIVTSCKEVYIPPAIVQPHNFLVVDGIINSGQDSTIITLSRTKNLTDTSFTTIPESQAGVFVEEEDGSSYLLPSLGNGKYGTGPLNLNVNKKYRLKIQTSNNQYRSDFVPVKQTPPVDSLSWNQPDDLTIYVNTHDPDNLTRYYRWEFDETWEYWSVYESFYIFENRHIRYRDSTEDVHKCYRHSTSNDIILGTSTQLSEDIVTNIPIVTIPQNSRKVSVKYSINVKQYALTEDAFKYWQILKKNTQQLGTLFDALPSELISNIHSETNAAEPVIGYVSISSVQEKRMFINTYVLRNWLILPEVICSAENFPDFTTAENYLLGHPELGPAYGLTGGGIAVSKHVCIDCRLLGGTNKKPSFWP